MNHKRLLLQMGGLTLVMLLLAACGTPQPKPSPIPPTPTATSTPAPTATPAATNTPVATDTPAPIPASTDPLKIGGFSQLQLAVVELGTALESSGGGTITKGALTLTANGMAPSSLGPGHQILTVEIKVPDGKVKQLTDTDIEIIDEGRNSISAAVIFTYATGNSAAFVFCVPDTSKLFQLRFPTGEAIDLAPILKK
jgi:hypothetical protein